MAINDPYATDQGLAVDQPAPDPQPAAPVDQPADNSAALQQQIAELQNQIAALQAENQQLQTQNAQLTSDNQALQGEVETANNTVDQLNQTLEQEKADHQADVQEAQTQIDELTKQAASGGQPDEATAAQLTTLQAENARLTEQLAQLQAGGGGQPVGAVGATPPVQADGQALPPFQVTGGGSPIGFGAPRLSMAFDNPSGQNRAPGTDYRNDLADNTFAAPPADRTLDGITSVDPGKDAMWGGHGEPTVTEADPKDVPPTAETTTTPTGKEARVWRDDNGVHVAGFEWMNPAEIKGIIDAFVASENASTAKGRLGEDVRHQTEQDRLAAARLAQEEEQSKRAAATSLAVAQANRQQQNQSGLAAAQTQRNAEYNASQAPTLGGRPLATPPVDQQALREQRAHEAALQQARLTSEQQIAQAQRDAQMQIAAMQLEKRRGSFRTPTFGRFRR